MMDAVGELIKSGRLLTDATEIGHLKSGDLLQQLQMWIHLKTIRMQVNNRHLLKDSAAAKVANKKGRLKSLISMNAATIDATVTRGTATVNSTPPSPQQQEDGASEQQSSSEDLEDAESYHHIQNARLHICIFSEEIWLKYDVCLKKHLGKSIQSRRTAVLQPIQALQSINRHVHLRVIFSVSKLSP